MSVIWVGTKHHGTSSGNQSAATTQKRQKQPEIELVKHFYSVIRVFTIILSVLGVSIGKRFESVRVNDAFFEDESVTFRACDYPKMFGGGIHPEEIGVVHIDVASFVKRLCDLIDQILTHDVIVKLLGSTNVQGELPHIAADFAPTDLVAIVLVTSGGEFCDEVAVIEFVRHLS